MTADRQTLNRAFLELGLRFQWDETTWAVLAEMPDLRTQLQYYLPRHQPHLLSVYDTEFLGRLIEQRVSRPGEGGMAMEATHSL
jgi:hypothetical protein